MIQELPKKFTRRSLNKTPSYVSFYLSLIDVDLVPSFANSSNGSTSIGCESTMAVSQTGIVGLIMRVDEAAAPGGRRAGPAPTLHRIPLHLPYK